MLSELQVFDTGGYKVWYLVETDRSLISILCIAQLLELLAKKIFSLSSLTFCIRLFSLFSAQLFDSFFILCIKIVSFKTFFGL